MDDRGSAGEMIQRSEFLEYMEAFEERLNARFDEKLHALDEKLEAGLGGVHAGLGGLEHRMKIQFEETRGLIRLSLEGLDALRETTERGFADVRRENQDNKTLLEAALKHVRRRVESIEDAARGEGSP
jgi:hypothetical protein